MSSGILFFDGDCGMCTRATHLLTRLNRTGKVRIEPLQTPGTQARLGVHDVEALMASVWWLGDDGTVRPAAHAIAIALTRATGVPVALWLYRVPGISQLAEIAYRWVAAHRQYFPGTTPHCTTSPDACGR